MGVVEGGFFVGLTNRRTIGPPEPARRSRGELVMNALHARSVDAVEKLLGGVDATAFNPFNLVFGDARDLRIAYGREGDSVVRVHPLSRGLHVLGNDTLGAPSWKTRRAEELARPLAERPWDELAPALHRLLGDHAMPPPEDVPEPPAWMDRDLARRLLAICVHTPVYGTRSATLAAIDAHDVRHLAFAPGPPCTTPMEDVTSLLVR
jgi:uncharacterized protein with NRDE domain